MARTTDKERKPKAPGTNISIDFDAGSDLNSGFGFSNAVQSIEAYHNVLAKYDFDDEDITLSLLGSTIASTTVNLNLSGITNARKIEIAAGSRTANMFIRNSHIPVEISVTTFVGNSASLIALDCYNLELSSSCSFNDRSGGALASIIAFDCFKVRVGIVSFSNYTDGSFVELANVTNFSYDPLGTPTGVGTLITAREVQYLQLENGGAAITGQILDLSDSPGIVIRRVGWAYTGTIADSFPDTYIIDGQQKFLNLPVYADDTAAGVGGLVTGDMYQTATGVLMIKL